MSITLQTEYDKDGVIKKVICKQTPDGYVVETKHGESTDMITIEAEDLLIALDTYMRDDLGDDYHETTEFEVKMLRKVD